MILLEKLLRMREDSLNKKQNVLRNKKISYTKQGEGYGRHKAAVV